MACSKRSKVICAVLAALAIVGVALGFVFGLRSSERAETIDWGAIASNGEGCAEIGGQMLYKGGSAVDAAIATLLCEGVVLPHSLGIGGGFVATIYCRKTGNVEALIARETAPAAADRDMFINKPITGALSAAIPSEIYGYWRMHDKYGKLPWRTLFQPTIEMCRNGIKVSKYLANVLNLNRDRMLSEPSMSEIFVDPKTKDVYKEGDFMYRRRLAETLTIIADEGPNVLYGGGRIGRMLVEDVQAMGGILTEEDLQNYEVRWEAPLNVKFTGGYQLFTTPLPTSGVVLAFILNVMEPLYTKESNVYWQRLIETFKHAYGHRTNLGDIQFEPQVAAIYDQLLSRTYADSVRKLIKDDRTFTDYAYYGANFTNEEDHGTANVAVVAPNGDAISITSTVNSHLGAKVRSQQTGIILNDEMDDFSTPGVVNAYGIPASPANYIKPGKIPMSSTCPSIILDKNGKLQLIVGGAGGSKITSSVAQTILRYFVLNESIEASVNQGRIHHQLAPMYIDIEPEVPVNTTTFLNSIGHELNFLPGNKAFSALTAIGAKNDMPVSICDRRRKGSSIVLKCNC